MRSYRFLIVTSIVIAVIWSRKSTPGFGFSNSTHLAMFKSLSKPNYNKIARYTAVLLLPTSDLIKRTSAILELYFRFRFDLWIVTDIGILL